MKKDFISAFLLLTVFAVLSLVLNILLYLIPGIGISTANFIYPLPVTYLFFYGCSFVILGLLVFVSYKSKEQLGYLFLLLTAAKMAIAYAFGSSVINMQEGNSTEKINFFVIFILFLIIEAYYTARLLNKK